MLLLLLLCSSFYSFSISLLFLLLLLLFLLLFLILILLLLLFILIIFIFHSFTIASLSSPSPLSPLFFSLLLIPTRYRSCYHPPQGVTKRCRLSWLATIAPSYWSPNAGGGGRGVSANEYSWTRSPNKLWRSNSIFNL